MATDHPDALAAAGERAASVIDAWSQHQLAENPIVEAVERLQADEPRWFIRVRGEEKDVYSVWMWLRQRTVHIETYFMPYPEENHAAVFRYLLTKNARMYGLGFSLGDEDAIYLSGQLDARWVDEDELDRLLGTAYLATEECFRTAVRLGFASRARS